MTKWAPWTLEPPVAPTLERARRITARWLRRAGRWLALVARHVHGETRTAAPEAPVFEFHAEAGAPEGALYVDGHLIGVLKGVTRL